MDQQHAGSILRLLETDYLLGIRHVPLRMAAANVAEIPAAYSRPAAAPAPATTRSATPAPAAVHARPAAAAPRPAATRGASAGPTLCPVETNHPKIVRLDIESAEYRKRFDCLRNLDDKQVKTCKKCHLCETRTKTVFGQGDFRTRLVFVGEAPGADEDQQGLAFVGKAGQLLTKMIEAMGLSREWVFICNILKCRPPENRTPVPEEINACWPFLDEQLRMIKPDVIVALGRPSAQTLLRTDASIGSLRGVWHEYYPSGTPGEGDPIPLMPTFHPAYLLRSPGEKGKAWSDLQQVMQRFDLTPGQPK